MKKSRQLKNKIISILPFISFKNPIIELEDYFIVSELALDKVQIVNDELKNSLKQYANNQNEFLKTTYKNPDIHTTFVIPKDNISKDYFSYFLETLFFYLHKGKITNFFFAPNNFCKEDFKYIVIDYYEDELLGKFIVKNRFKLQIKNKFDDFIISPSGCENVLSPELEKYNYQYREIDLDSKNFSDFWNITKDKKNTMRAISFYNKTMSCELSDDERFVWLSSALESFLEIGKNNKKSEEIKKSVCEIVCDKNFKVLNKCDVIYRISSLIKVVYDYRSSYIHGGKRSTDSKALEKKLTEYFGKIDFVVALMNLASTLLVHDQVEDNRFESILNVLFYNQDVFNETVEIFKDSADNAKTKLNDSQAMVTIERFRIADLQSIQFDSCQIYKCLNNILYIFAQFALGNKENTVAIKIQKEINKIGKDDPEKYKKWNDFLSEINSSNELTIEIYYSILVFRRLFELLKYEFTLY